MASWDVFHADSLELERGVSTRRDPRGAGGRSPAGRRPGPSGGHDGGMGPSRRLSRAGVARRGRGRAERRSRRDAGGTRRRRSPTVGPNRGRRRSEARSGSAPGASTSPSAHAEPSDFEVRADHLGTTPQPESPAASTTTASPPAWLELGGEPDDVTFPVIPGRPDEPRFAHGGLRTRRGPSRNRRSRRHGIWPDDEDDIEAARDEHEPEDGDFDDQIEILEDEEGPGDPGRGWAERTRPFLAGGDERERCQPGRAAGCPVARLE